MKTAIIQLNPKTADIDENSDRIKLITEKEKNSDLIIFPTLAITGINCRDYFKSKDFTDKQNAAIQELQIISQNLNKDIIIGIAESDDNKLYSSIALIQDGRLDILCRKSKLTNEEARYFSSGKGSASIKYKGRYITATLDNENINSKTDLLLNFALENYQMDTLSRRLIDKNYAEIKINPVCLSGSYLYDGRSFVSNKKGKKILLAKAFEEDVMYFDDERHYEELKRRDINVYEETIEALSFGLKDFCRKNGFKKIVLGLSGGIDSALTAAIACKAMGSGNVHGITMPSEYSSSGSVEDSYALAKNLGMTCETKSIKPLFDSFVENIQEKKYFDLAEENLQSRLRGVILMNYSNRNNALLLSTGNKSEVATGYCTLYGDTCGGLCLLSDIYKTDVYRIAEKINKDKEIIPVSTMTKAPSAELRPDQKDSDSLPEYDVLDKVIKLYFEEGMPINEIKKLCVDKPVEQIIKTVLRAEFKRKQMTSGIKLSEYSFVCDIDYPAI